MVTYHEVPKEDGTIHFSWTNASGKQFNRLVNLIKSDIPAIGRRFDPESKAWFIGKEHAGILEEIKRRVARDDAEEFSDIDAGGEIDALSRMLSVDSPAKLRGSMRPRAEFAIRAILALIPAEVEYSIERKMFAAYHEESGVWVWPDGRYSTKSPSRIDECAVGAATAFRSDAIRDAREVMEKFEESVPDQKSIFRSRMLQKYAYRCHVCGASPDCLSDLHMHRVIPGTHGGMYVEDNVVVLCSGCHPKMEGLSWKEITAAAAVVSR